ncbi:DUF1194 domain-containing protein [Salinarimonas soli]|uniref:DUF1194 domain-containing protein n=1 Tax=Salinarimonas soli TaxID=1638099 RepID=A0A5B2VH54_9HYPH|nr:DUF1194 domain-containing protein [Salinarimonas soli]KAA2237948.1 DUF1194 domain-containing protein [Salinarimonas soli]
MLLRALVLSLALLAAAPVRAAEEVDLALVIAVDVSNSMDPEEQELQRDGFVEAFRSAEVHGAIARGALGRIAVVYMDWAGTGTQGVVVPWTIIDGPEAAAAFAARLESAPNRRAPRTSISGALDFSMRLLGQSGVEAIRQVIDVSGDGANNQGRPVLQAREAALARGVTINGLPIMLKRPTGSWDVAHLDAYYRDCVIGGAGAFMIPIRERRDFATAVRTKLVREIADLGPEASFTRVQAEARVDCMAGERAADDWWRN